MIANMVCSDRCSILEAMQKINVNCRGCVFIVNQDDKLCGVLTDGDIRRLLLAGSGLNDSIKPLLKDKFVFACDHEEHSEILSKINDKIKVIPIVDNDFHVVDFFECKTNFKIPVAMPDLTGNELKYLTDAFLSTWISSSGQYIDRFEKSVAEYCGSQYGIASSNGTTALHLAMLGLGIGPGDEVIVPDLTFAATINTVLHSGATPVIVDIEPRSWCIDPVEIEKAITPQTRAIVPVHLFGQPADMKSIMAIAAQHNLFVIEDCAEAQGAEYADHKVGSIGDVGCFSFFANKIITCGEGGMCITNNPLVAEKIRAFRDHGMSAQKRYWHDVVGYNYRMTNLQAAIGLAQMERIDGILDSKRRIEYAYRRRLFSLGQLHFQADHLPDRKKITWLVSCLVDGNRDQTMDLLKKEGIDCRPFFYPLGDMPIYTKYVFSNTVSRRISSRGIMFPTNWQCDKTILDKIYRLLLTSNPKIPLSSRETVVDKAIRDQDTHCPAVIDE